MQRFYLGCDWKSVLFGNTSKFRKDRQWGFWASDAPINVKRQGNAVFSCLFEVSQGLKNKACQGLPIVELNDVFQL